MSTSLICAGNSVGQDSELSTLTIQQQHLQLRQKQRFSNLAATHNMLVEDAVHGVIELPSFIEELVKHPLFQRLKTIKQLGLLSLAERPQAIHTRFEHCIGTYKSAQVHLNALRRNSNYEPELPEWCRQSVEIAALLHDLGHGPFSHNWESVCGGSFNHEDNSLLCVDEIFAEVKSKELVSLRDDSNGRGLQLIKALLVGESERLSFPMMGHGYIFDIVHNSRCGLDVDKWDYLRRDNEKLKVLSKDQMQFDEVFENARISPDGQRIEYRYEDYHLIYKLFVARWTLYVCAYKLPKSLAFEVLLKKIVHRSPQNLLDLRGDSSGWRNFNDNQVLQMIASDPQAVYLSAPDRWHLTEHCDQQKDEQQDDHICVIAKKLGPGDDMQADECYALYGDKRKKRNITRERTPTIIQACFKLQ